MNQQITNNQKLEQVSNRIIELKKHIGLNCFELGRHLLELRDQKLYLEKYPTWTAYLRDGVDLGERSAFKFIRIAENYNQEQVEAWGVHKLDLILQLEESKQQEFLDTHDPQDTSFREMKRELPGWKQKANEIRDYPQQNPSIEFFTVTEMRIQQLIALIRETQDHLTACGLNPEFNTYLRRGIILQSWQSAKEEINKETNGKM